MAHLRERHLANLVLQYIKFWPVIGVIGLRQSGKTTLFEKILKLKSSITLDDRSYIDEIKVSPIAFLNRFEKPLLIDEAQKEPLLFDAIKLAVDRNRIPGAFLLTGSSQFSAKIGIRESLTGRIGVLRLYPFTLSEAHQSKLEIKRAEPNHLLKQRFSAEQFLKQLDSGGLPVPLFSRETNIRKIFFQEWLDTTIHRDLALNFGKNYRPEISWSILDQLSRVLINGEHPTLTSFKQNSRVLRKYLDSMEQIFLLTKLTNHEVGVGKEVWLPADSGIANFLMKEEAGEDCLKTKIRIQLLNEIIANSEYSGKRIRPIYYKSSRGTPIDLIWNDYAVKVSTAPLSQLEYDIKSLDACVKKLKLKGGYLASAYTVPSLRASRIKIVPWSHWS